MWRFHCDTESTFKGVGSHVLISPSSSTSPPMQNVLPLGHGHRQAFVRQHDAAAHLRRENSGRGGAVEGEQTGRSGSIVVEGE